MSLLQRAAYIIHFFFSETLNQDADAGPEALIRRMHEAVFQFADRAPQFDDITMLCLKYYGTQGGHEFN